MYIQLGMFSKLISIYMSIKNRAIKIILLVKYYCASNTGINNVEFARKKLSIFILFSGVKRYSQKAVKFRHNI